jgi:hypothetical protein
MFIFESGNCCDYADLEGFSEVGKKLGEEEWIVMDFETVIDSQDGHSHFSFDFTANRHLTYYIFRIFSACTIELTR